jgi:hypothetical protein
LELTPEEFADDKHLDAADIVTKAASARGIVGTWFICAIAVFHDSAEVPAFKDVDNLHTIPVLKATGPEACAFDAGCSVPLPVAAFDFAMRRGGFEAHDIFSNATCAKVFTRDRKISGCDQCKGENGCHIAGGVTFHLLSPKRTLNHAHWVYDGLRPRKDH